MSPPTVTDRQKDALEAAILAAVLLIYRGTMQAIRTTLGLGPGTAPAAAQRRLATFAADRAATVQTGIAIHGAAALAILPDDAGPDERQAALDQSKQEMAQHNRDALIPLIVSYAIHQARVDALSSIPNPDGTGSLAETVSWTWTQHTEYDDDCATADAASPAPLDDLLAITGSMPPTHDGCQCECEADLDGIDLSATKALTRPVTKAYDDEIGLNVSFDLDDTALQFPAQLSAVAWAVVRSGGRVSVLTGNQTAEARALWDAYGYPMPHHWRVHSTQDAGEIAAWKAQACADHHVDLIIDDFKRGTIAEEVRRLLPHTTLSLQALVHDGIPVQDVGRTKTLKRKSQAIERTVRKFVVRPKQVDTVRTLLAAMLGPEPYDAMFHGQRVQSLYFDTADGRAYQARLQALDYVTLRLRTYPDGARFLEAKTPRAKYREPLADADADALVSGGDVTAMTARVLPEIAEAWRALVGSEPVAGVAAVEYTRFAREAAGNRVSLDIDLRAGDRAFTGAVLECKYEGEPVLYPQFVSADLVPVNLSKMLWTMSPVHWTALPA